MKKYRTGYTTGVFDMFHIGHLNILRRAKAQCEYLIVGVSTDELVEQYKHKRPVVSYEDRKAIVEAIKFVDEVVPQTSLDKRLAWDMLHFDAIFHGDDWKGSAMYKTVEEELKKVGCDLVFLPHTEGVSSTVLSKTLFQYLQDRNDPYL